MLYQRKAKKRTFKIANCNLTYFIGDSCNAEFRQSIGARQLYGGLV